MRKFGISGLFLACGAMVSCISNGSKSNLESKPEVGTNSCSAPNRKNTFVGLTNHSRKPAQAADEKPPTVKSRAAWLFSWTHSPLAQLDAKAYVAQQFNYAQDCISKFKQSDDEVPHCEGNGMAAGPGLYLVDNPFTSHGYGSTAVMVRTLEQAGNVSLVTGRFAPAAASGGIDRSIFADPQLDALVYNFEPTPFNDRAIVMRSGRIIDPAQTTAVTLSPLRQKFAQHEDHDCAQDKSVQEVLAHWGDQIDFMSFAFGPESNEQDGFVKGNVLQPLGITAAIATDVGQIPDDQIATLVARLQKISPDMKHSLTDIYCQETSALSPRACLIARVFTSLNEKPDIGQRVFYSWKRADMLKAAALLGLINSKSGPISSVRSLRTKLIQNFQADKVRSARVMQAYQCMVRVRESLRAENLQTWGADPE